MKLVKIASQDTITLQPAEIDLILSASQASLHTKELNRIYGEELADLASSPSFAALTFPAAGLFLRLDEWSSKDGVRGTSPLRSIEEIILHVCTSHRATNAMIRHAEKRRGPMELVFLPRDARMSTSREFRVFCAPPDGRVTAVSQYGWHQPSVYRDRDSGELDGLMQVVMDEIVRIHGEIMAEAKGERGGDMDGLLLRQGFTFDVMFVV
ncbi:hypothetical protein LZ554_004412 [Drepanopeziza brunnea f. sp. 'monogermtubi']|nr:hypothetical protein LZ554_004412 [Drepanopeziza brunnea f. sp. 'monogermtubi']